MFTALSNGAKTAWASLSGMSKFLIGGAGLVMAFNVGKSLVDHFSTSIDEAKERLTVSIRICLIKEIRQNL